MCYVHVIIMFHWCTIIAHTIVLLVQRKLQTVSFIVVRWVTVHMYQPRRLAWFHTHILSQYAYMSADMCGFTYITRPSSCLYILCILSFECHRYRFILVWWCKWTHINLYKFWGSWVRVASVMIGHVCLSYTIYIYIIYYICCYKSMEYLQN